MSLRLVPLLLLLLLVPFLARAGTDSSFPLIGWIEPRDASEIESSRFGVGGETMGRDYTIFANWKDHLGPLGAKKVRLQSGWAKTEKVPGQYDWAWHDEIFSGVVAQGVEPWVTLCYGNPAYPDGGTDQAGSPLPASPEALAGWDRFVRAFVQRYGDDVDEWEIWNEPQHKGISIDDYVDFYIRTAEIIRREQPGAELLALSTAGIRPDLTEAFLRKMQARGKLDLVDAITFHPYSYNPDEVIGKVLNLRRVVESFPGDIRIYQAENGAPSERGASGALGKYDWTETSQAKWALRRLLNDFALGIESSYFSLIDMWYAIEGVNRKGLIYSQPDKTVGHRKEAYGALQSLFSLFDSHAEPDPSLLVSHTNGAPMSVFGFRRNGYPIAALWENRENPGDGTELKAVNVIVNTAYEEAVQVDLRTGEVRAIPAESWSYGDGVSRFTGIGVYDSPVLIVERAAIPAMKEVGLD